MSKIIDKIEVYNASHYKISMTLLEDVSHITVTSSGRMGFSVFGSKPCMGSTSRVGDKFKMIIPRLPVGSQVVIKFIENLYMSNGMVNIELVSINGDTESLTIRARDIFEKNGLKK